MKERHSPIGPALPDLPSGLRLLGKHLFHAGQVTNLMLVYIASQVTQTLICSQPQAVGLACPLTTDDLRRDLTKDHTRGVQIELDDGIGRQPNR